MGISKVRAGITPIRILFIGNSYTYCNDMPNILENLSAGSTNCMPIETKIVALGGATLQAHWESGEALHTLTGMANVPP